jgi:type VI secretion system protein ImpA
VALIDFASLAEPVSDSAPCGPDCDLEGDLDFMNFVARAEGLLPATFFTRDDESRLTPFDRTTIAFDAEFKTLATLLETTRDLRLLTILAKFKILNRELADFAATLQAIARLVTERWADIHPRGEDGDFTLRMVTLQTLDDSPTVVLPLQHAPLVPSRRFGFISYRNIMVRQGEATAREDEDTPDDSAIEAAFREAEFPALVGTRDSLATLKSALAAVQAAWIENAGYEQALSFPKLGPLVDKMLATVERVIGQRDPDARLGAAPAASAADEGARAAPGGSAAYADAAAGPVRSAAEAAAALAAAAAYFARSEPSSPALLLIRQAQDLVGKSFRDVLQALVPAQAEQATIRIGVDHVFELPIERLSGVVAAEPDEPLSDGAAEVGASWDEALEGESAADEQSAGALPDVGAASSGAEDQPAEDSGTEAPPPGPQSATPARNPAGRAGPAAALTRQQAVAMLEQVSAFYRMKEPASPIPLLVDRACGLSQKDFLTLLKDILPGLKMTSE